MNDKELLEKAIYFGKNALHWRQLFIGLLPEINKRRLYEQKGCSSIGEFAAKFGGVSKEQLKLTIKLEERFTEMPRLHEALVTGEVSINKLARVVSIATPENEVELFNMVSNLSNRAVETLVRDEKFTGLHVQELSLNEEVKNRLIELQEKGIDINELISTALNKREEEIAEEKAMPVGLATSRPVPAKTERLLEKEHGTKCSIPTCKKPSVVIHHTQTFAISHSHNPNYLAPLCKEHHEIAHAINLKVRGKRLNLT